MWEVQADHNHGHASVAMAPATRARAQCRAIFVTPSWIPIPIVRRLLYNITRKNGTKTTLKSTGRKRGHGTQRFSQPAAKRLAAILFFTHTLDFSLSYI
jgi:hypothetical protein